ncbi:unnamed protein product [Closterium sp. NIES-65]|nr:unnamed protein product [Closterium sp. NIES-65]
MEASTQIYTGSPDLGTETPATEEDPSSFRRANDKTASEFRGRLIGPHQNDPHQSRPTNRLTSAASGRVNPDVVRGKQNAGCTRVEGHYNPIDKSPILVAMRATDEDIGKVKGVDVLGPTSPLSASLPVSGRPNRKHGQTQQQDPVTGDTLGVRGEMLSDTRDEQVEQKGGAASLDGHRHGVVIDRNASKPTDEDNGQAAPEVTLRTASEGHDVRLRSSATASMGPVPQAMAFTVLIRGPGGTHQMASVPLLACALPNVPRAARAAARLPNFVTAISFIDVVERLLPIPSTIRLPTEGANDAKEAANMGLPIRAQARVDALARAVTRLPTFDTAITFIDVVERLMPSPSAKRQRTDIDAP